MTNTFPTIELLEQTHDFPTSYMFKVIGKSERGFVGRAVAALREELGLDIDPPFRARDAVGGRHVSVTMQPMILRPQQVVDIYHRLSKLDGLVMLL